MNKEETKQNKKPKINQLYKSRNLM